MKSASVLVGTVLSVLLLGAGATLYYLTPPDLDEHFRSAIGTIQNMQQIGAEWSVETARVRADPSANFDGLAAFVPRMKEMKDELSRSLSRIPDLSERVTADARAYVAAVDSLRERVERFKTAYAVIRNSERYLPLVSTDLMLRAEQAADASLAIEISDITQEFNVFLASPDDAARERLTERIRKLSEGSVQEDPAVASTIANFVAHAEVLLAKRGRSEELFQGIASSTLGERVSPLTDALEAEQGERRRLIGLYQQGMVAAGASVLIVWVFVGFNRRSKSKPDSALPKVPSSTRRDAILDSNAEPEREESPGVEADSPLIERKGVEPSGERDDRAGADVMDALLTSGALAGLLGQNMGAYIRRMNEDLTALRSTATGVQGESDAEGAASRWKRLNGDTRRLGFFAQRLVVLARHLAPRDRDVIDVNECLGQVLGQARVGIACAVLRRFETVPGVLASKMEIRLLFTLCVEYALHAFQDIDSAEAELEVSTSPGKSAVTVAFIHNGSWLPPEQRVNQFVPFYGSQGQQAGLELPAALYLARKCRGTVSIDTLPDERTAVLVQLPVNDART